MRIEDENDRDEKFGMQKSRMKTTRMKTTQMQSTRSQECVAIKSGMLWARWRLCRFSDLPAPKLKNTGVTKTEIGMTFFNLSLF